MSQESRPCMPWWRRLLAALGSLKLAVWLLSFLLVLTYFGTVDQEKIGLYQAQKKYFDSYFVFIKFWEGTELPGFGTAGIPLLLPGAYLVSAVLFVNLLIGGVMLLRRGWRRVGILIAHLGIIFLLIGGVVGHHASQRGYVMVYEGEKSNVAVDYMHPQLEVTELQGNQPQKVHVVPADVFKSLIPEDKLKIRMANLPFDIEIRQFSKHCAVVNVHESPPRPDEKVNAIDGFYLFPMEMPLVAETAVSGCLAKAVSKDGSESSEIFIIADRSGSNLPPYTLNWKGKSYFVDLIRQRWVLPYEVKLDRFKVEFYPGSNRPKAFQSWVTRFMPDGSSEPVHIEMNKPMRHGGLTFFQAGWGPEQGAPDRKLYSRFEVVRNPADRWPEWAMWVIAAGLVIHFIWTLIEYLKGGKRRTGATSEQNS